MSESPKISVVLPVYNTPRPDLLSCIQCLRRQTASSFEVLVVDDGCEEGLASYIQEICSTDERFFVIRKRNGGVSSARNAGLRLARGEALCFVDADDIFADWMLEDLWSALHIEPEIEVACGYFDIIHGKNHTFLRENGEVSICPSDYLRKCSLIGTTQGGEELGYLACGPVAIMIKSDLAKRIPYNQEIHYMEDTINNYLRFCQVDSVAILKETIYAYRMNTYSATHSYSYRVVQNRIKAMEQLSSIASDDQEWLALRILANYFICCRNILFAKEEGVGVCKKIQRIRSMSSDPIWSAFYARGIDKNWSFKNKVKRRLAMWKIAPLFIALKGE